ncbi:phosphoribosylanthranilate isomerase [Candidatus Gracilibacteria bacterium]|nr:phosphoribosylanthranilate isomerase [Candidatus Gracilibacteria bacterium]MCF7856009.1 phosphoribosylanthranilate isomerase [Candidatus Gracilibacteria bacterium]MCF7896436.1 phosphoribosylanthranilate isomerase [Candidatus Gracilibacteria bacterium]
MPPKVKICGITNFADAELAVKLGAHYLGLNFFEASPRSLDPNTAANLSLAIKSKFPRVKLVGVFVDESLAKIRLISEICELDILQCHGNETPKFCAQWNLPVWKAFRVKNENSFGDLEQFLALDGIVLDAFKKGQFGGTGQTFDWELIHRIRDEIPFFILAGGINPQNVKKAAQQLKPDVIDVCSGVEMNDDPCKKDPAKLKNLFEELRDLS